MKRDANQLKALKGKEKISMITCYDYSFAKAVDGAADILLVGDSLGNVVLGYERTNHVMVADIVRHVEAVARGSRESFIVADLPFGSYENETEAIETARIMIEAGAHAVKPEGKPEIVKAIVAKGIPVMGHLGLLPQTAQKLGVVGRQEEEAKKIIEDAQKIEEAGAFSLVLETIPKELAKKVSEGISVPTIGIGAGSDCDGQVLVLYDMLGLFSDFSPKFVRKYMNLKDEVRGAIEQYSQDVKKGDFPSEKESFS